LEKLEMKKTLVAMAALAVVGAASAQSSVTLYGRVDVNLSSMTQSTNGVKTADNNRGLEMATGNAQGQTGARWGLKGTEDLGGGMSAMFMLENGFAADNATLQQVGRIFGRQAYVGLGGGFGTVTLGRQYTPLDGIWGSYDAQGYNTTAPVSFTFQNGPQNYGSSAAVVGVHNDTGRVSNAVMYATPNISGLTASIMWAPGENKNPVTGVGATRYWGGSVQYNNGPLGLGLGYENSNFKTAAATTSMSDVALGAQYNFGPAAVYGLYNRGRSNLAAGTLLGTNTTNGIAAGAGGLATGPGVDKGWDIGVKVPMGAFTFATSYAREVTTATGAVAEGKNTAWGAQVNYALSKRTQVYAIYLDGKSTTAANVATKLTSYSFGLRNDF